MTPRLPPLPDPHDEDRRRSQQSSNTIFWFIMFAVFLALWAWAELR